MVEGPDTAGGDDGNVYGVGDGPRELNIVPVLGAVLVHTRQHELPRPVLLHSGGPLHRIDPRRRSAAVDIDFPCKGTIGTRNTLGVDGHNDALGTESFTCFRHELGPVHRSRVDTHLVGAGFQEVPDIFQVANPPSHRQGNKDRLGGSLDHIEDDLPLVGGSCDIQEGDFVGALFVVGGSNLNRIAGVNEVDELNALDHTSLGHIKTRDDPSGEFTLARVHRASPSF